MSDNLSNNAFTTVDGAHNASTTTLTVADTSNFPAGSFWISVQNPKKMWGEAVTSGEGEIMLAEVATGTTLDVTRGQGGTSGISLTDGWAVYQNIASRLLDQKADLEGSTSQTFNVATATADEHGVRLEQLGVLMADQWRLTTSFAGDANPIGSNLERVDTNAFAQIGSGMSESSGTFSFPETGIYFVDFHHVCSYAGNSSTNQAIIRITTDNSVYSIASSGYSSINQVSTVRTYANSSSFIIFNVTDVSTHKVRFQVAVADNGVETFGDTDLNGTFMTFIKLGTP